MENIIPTEKQKPQKLHSLLHLFKFRFHTCQLWDLATLNLEFCHLNYKIHHLME